MAWRGMRTGLAAALAVLTAVCAGGAEFSGEVDESSDLGPLPFDRYEHSAELYERYKEAEALLVRACMAERGFKDFPLDPADPVTVLKGTVLVFAGTDYGLLDLAKARRWGYGWDPSVSPLEKPKGRRMTMAEYRELPDCNAHASKELLRGVDVKADWLYATRRTVAVDKAAAADPRLRQAWERWSDCVVDKGFKRYADPVAAYNAWDRASDGNTARTDEEIATAAADVTCKRALGTVRVWHTVRAEKQRADIDRHRPRYAASLRALGTYRANIDGVLTRLG